MPREEGLWSRSAAWRWTLVLTGLATAIVVLIGPWNSPSTGPLALATYAPPPAQQVLTTSPQYASSAIAATSLQAPASGWPDKTFNVGATPLAPTFPAGTELHAVGVYEGGLPPGESEQAWWTNCMDVTGDRVAMVKCHGKYAGRKSVKTITIQVSRSGPPIVLALMAYNPVNWKIVKSPDVDIRKIVIGGYHGQSIEGISDDLPVDVFTYESSSCTNCSRYAEYFYAYKKDTPEYKNAISKLLSITGLKTKSFQLAHKSEQFSLSHSTAPMKLGALNVSTKNKLDPYSGQNFSNQVELAGMLVPLPDGSWRGIAFARNSSNRGRDELLVLARLENDQLRSMVAVRGQVTNDGRGFPAQSSCERRDVHAREVKTNISSGTQLCYWVDHATQIWAQPIFNLAATHFDGLGIETPDTLINGGFHKADSNSSLTVYYFSNPETAGITTPQTSWSASPWHPKRIKAFPDKAAFIQDYSQWAESWFPIFEVTRPQ